MPDSTFVRKSFYIQPPPKDASPEEWQEWLRKDVKKAAAAKRAHTKAQQPTATPDAFREGAMRKVNGVWKQTPSVGFVGSVDDGTCRAEPTEDAYQAKLIIMSQWAESPRGTKSKSRHARRRKNKM